MRFIITKRSEGRGITCKIDIDIRVPEPLNNKNNKINKHNNKINKHWYETISKASYES
jgi:hypothetical protein